MYTKTAEEETSEKFPCFMRTIQSETHRWDSFSKTVQNLLYIYPFKYYKFCSKYFLPFSEYEINMKVHSIIFVKEKS